LVKENGDKFSGKNEKMKTGDKFKEKGITLGADEDRASGPGENHGF